MPTSTPSPALRVLDATAYRLWLQLGIAGLALGLFVGGLGQWFAPQTMSTLGRMFLIPGGALVTAGIAVAGLTAHELSTGVRMAALIGAGLLALVTL